MILIVDSGATKADWCLVNDKKERTYLSSRGLNPYNTTIDDIKKEIETKILPFVDSKKVGELTFYGAGCGAESKRNEMQALLKSYFLNAHIKVEHDLLGAARAVCNKEEGLVAILGTGSNSCLYDGVNIVKNIPALGYILCDEGAGTNIGKLLLKDYLQDSMPKEIAVKFAQQYKGKDSDFLDNLYKGDTPNYYLASFAKFAMDNQTNIYLREIIVEAFENFFINQVMRYSTNNKTLINVVGSVGFLAGGIFKDVAKKYGFKVGRIIQAPLEELVNYHLQWKV